MCSKVAEIGNDRYVNCIVDVTIDDYNGFIAGGDGGEMVFIGKNNITYFYTCCGRNYIIT